MTELYVEYHQSMRDSNAEQFAAMLPQPKGHSIPEFVDYLDELKQAVPRIESAMQGQAEEYRTYKWYTGLLERVELGDIYQIHYFCDPIATDGPFGNHAAAIAKFRNEPAQILTDYPGDAKVEEQLEHEMSLIDTLVDQAERTFDQDPQRWNSETSAAN